MAKKKKSARKSAAKKSAPRKAAKKAKKAAPKKTNKSAAQQKLISAIETVLKLNGMSGHKAMLVVQPDTRAAGLQGEGCPEGQSWVFNPETMTGKCVPDRAMN